MHTYVVHPSCSIGNRQRCEESIDSHKMRGMGSRQSLWGVDLDMAVQCRCCQPGSPSDRGGVKVLFSGLLKTSHMSVQIIGSRMVSGIVGCLEICHNSEIRQP